MNIIERWLVRPAKWYQFWLPQSSFIGGIILVGVTLILLTLLGVVL